mmetsp:Transcript_10002/g.11694  ORF Transcript_10002/g.11694 Transcript_10002/m.11694 type:complete len:106 (+) Transcript_10002:396-713(+)
MRFVLWQKKRSKTMTIDYLVFPFVFTISWNEESIDHINFISFYTRHKKKRNISLYFCSLFVYNRLFLRQFLFTLKITDFEFILAFKIEPSHQYRMQTYYIAKLLR